MRNIFTCSMGENDNYKGGLYRRVNIPYPPAAQENGDEGKVILEGVVSPEGKLESIKVDRTLRF